MENLDLNLIFYNCLTEYENLFNEYAVQSGQSNTLFKIIEKSNNFNTVWQTRETKYLIKFETLNQDFLSANQTVSQLFSSLYQTIKQDCQTNDKVRIVFNHEDIFYPISTAFIPISQLNANMMIGMIERVCQSNRNLRIDEAFEAKITIVHLPAGAGRPSSDMDKFISKRRSIKIIYNKDKLCALRAILVSKAYVDKDPKRNELCNINSQELDQRTFVLAKNLNINEDSFGINEVKLVEDYLKDYQITIINGNSKTNEPLHIGKPNQKHIYIWYIDGHYNSITSMNAFLNRTYFCHECKQGYNNLSNHYCQNICQLCRRPDCKSGYRIQCELCNKWCNNKACLKSHINQFCIETHKCPLCKESSFKNHVCIGAMKWCKNCKLSVDINNHKCYILKEIEKKKNKKNRSFQGLIFFDYECQQDQIIHVPNLIYAKVFCVNCLDKTICNYECGIKKFNNNDSFCSWLFTQSNFIAIAHNLKAYDGCFIQNYILKNLLPNEGMPNVIVQGTKLLNIYFRKVKLIDSASFIPMPLEKFSSTFGITELKKGYFPHLFNTNENKNYVGKYPDKEYYGVKFFSKKKLEAFDKWYEKVKDNVFDFDKELNSYCLSDVELLAAGCLTFRDIIMNLSSSIGDTIDPFFSSITIASLCHVIFRTSLIKENQIAFIPETGYNPEKLSSTKAIQWMDYLSTINEIKIIHAGNGTELNVGPYKIDGFCDSNKTFYEFHGCLFHGCPRCFTGETVNPCSNKTMAELYARHEKRINFIINFIKDVQLIQIWECEWDEMFKNDENIRIICENSEYQLPLNPRESLFGGRTNAIKLYHKCLNDEKIKYIDFTSLYPYVQKYCRFPIGHPKIIKDNFKSVKEYFGIIKCKVLPPKGLFYPVLPSKINNKLVFTLCRTCAQLKINNCKHNNNERSLIGTWVTLEVIEAIKYGYEILKIYEVWDWEESSVYDPVSKTGGLFVEYVNLFLKGKQESSGYPNWVKNDDDKNKFIKEFFEKEGILLEKNNIEYNSGKRFVYKLALNSFWGRFGLNANKTQYKVLKNPHEWFALLNNDQFMVQSADISVDNCIQVFFSNKYNEGSIETNIPIASFVTCHARLKLYSELKKLSERVLYFDTDSIIYLSKKGLYEPVLGDYLGEFTSELGDEEYIDEFVSAGPKNYAFKINDGSTKCTIKGFSFSTDVDLKINFESIRDLVLGDHSSKISVEQFKFKRNKSNWDVYCETYDKQYGFVYDKRVLLADLSTLPYGY